MCVCVCVYVYVCVCVCVCLKGSNIIGDYEQVRTLLHPSACEHHVFTYECKQVHNEDR